VQRAAGGAAHDPAVAVAETWLLHVWEVVESLGRAAVEEAGAEPGAEL
jgi:hypothetical protein